MSVTYDFKAWRMRLDISRDEAAELLGIKVSTFDRMEHVREGREVYAWACHGLEAWYLKEPGGIDKWRRNK